MNKKTLLNSAIALALGSMASGAFAVVNIDTGSGVMTFTNEPVNVNAAALDPFDIETPNIIDDFGNVDENLDLISTVGFSVTQGETRFFRIDLMGATFAEKVVASDLTFQDAFAGAPFPSDISVSVSEGGNAGDTSVVFEVSPTAPIDGAFDVEDTFTLAVDAVNGDSLNSQGKVRYRLFEDPNEAQSDLAGGFDAPPKPEETLVDKQNTWFNRGSGFGISCDFVPGQGSLIDVIDQAFFEDAPFAPGAQFKIADANARTTTGVYSAVTGEQVNLTEYFPQSTSADFSFRGDFQGISQVILFDDFVPGTLGQAILASFSNFATSTNPQRVGADPGYTPVYFDGPPSRGWLGVDVIFQNGADRDGDGAPDDMIPSQYLVEFVQTVPLGSDVNFNLDPDSRSAPCGETMFSGSRDRLDFTADPSGEGASRTFFRIVNPSEQPGEVSVTIINDDGDMVTVDLGDVNGTGVDVLGAKSSTNIYPVAALLAAAQAADPSFDVAEPGQGGRNKLRVEVAGKFGNNAFDGNIRGNLSVADIDQNGISVPPSVSGFVQVRGQEVTSRRADGIQIQGFIASESNFIVPYNVDR